MEEQSQETYALIVATISGDVILHINSTKDHYHALKKNKDLYDSNS